MSEIGEAIKALTKSDDEIYSLVGKVTSVDKNMWENDIGLFIDRAFQLQENLNSLADIF